VSGIEVEGRTIDEGAAAFLIAEMGANHDRDLNQALALVDLAADTGFDAIKLQTYTAESLTTPSEHPSACIDPVWGARNLYELYQAAAMPMEFHAPLFERARERGLVAFTSVYDPRDLDFLEDLGNPLYKIASYELSHLPLLAEVAKTGKPIVLSTGMANLGEVEEALETIEQHRGGPLLLLHCCSAYPATAEAVNLNAIDTLKHAFQLPVGFSDHTFGAHIPLAAVMRGACALEKHYTNDANRRGPDHRFSATPEVMKQIASQVRACEAALGSGRKALQKVEEGNKSVGRRSIYVVRDVSKDKCISEDTVRVVRPGAGLHPRFLSDILGRRARRALTAGEPLTWDDLA
jgi:pseudaminic acid synthase